MVDVNIDRALRKKLDLMIKRVTDDDENDNYLIVEGDTGSGKTNMSVGLCHEVAKATGREFNVKNIFFDTDKAVDYAKTTSHKIIIFDEPAFGGLKAEWRNKTQINLVKLLYTARIKRHFVVFNLVKFSKFSDEIIEKAIALIRIYKRNEASRERRFLYIPKKRIYGLLDTWKRKHIRAYSKYSILHGTVFRYVMPEIIDMNEYNKMKADAILMIGEEKENHLDKIRILTYQYNIALMPARLRKAGFNVSNEIYSKFMGISPTSITRWSKLIEKYPFLVEKQAPKTDNPPLIIVKGNRQKPINQSVAEMPNNK